MPAVSPLFRLLPLALILAALLAVPAPAASDELDVQIRFWTARQDRDPFDPGPSFRLGYACLQKARVSGDYGYYARAETALSRGLKLKPEDYDGTVALAAVRAAQHRFADARSMAETAARLRPQEPAAYGTLGDAAMGMGDLDAAEKAYRKLMEMLPGLFSYGRWANLRFLRGDIRGALDYFSRALNSATERNQPAYERVWCMVQMGDIDFGRGRWEAAEKQYQAALELLPDSFLPLEHLAELRAAQGKNEEALALYRKVLALAPHPEFHEAIAGVHEAMGRKDEAARAYDLALAGYLKAVEAGDIGHYRDLARFYCDVRPNPAEALRWARKDMEVRQDVHSHATLAWALYHGGDLPAAEEAMRKALAAGTRDADLFYQAGMISHRLGRRAEAKRHLERALEANPRFPDREEIQATLRTLARR